MQVRGPKKHLKRLNAPSNWMLDKLTGVWAPKPSAGPHKTRECLPLIIFLRNRLKYALTKKEVTSIVKQRLIKIDGKVRTDTTYPAGFMDVITIEKTGEHFRLLYDIKGRFALHRITAEEAKVKKIKKSRLKKLKMSIVTHNFPLFPFPSPFQFKLCRIKKLGTGAKGIPYIVTHDGRTIRYPDPAIKAHDVVLFEIETGKIADHIKLDSGNLCFVTGGHNMGRIGTIVNRERHQGSFDIVHVKDALGHSFATRLGNIFVIGKANKPLISLPQSKGIKLTIIEERDRRLERLRK